MTGDCRNLSKAAVIQMKRPGQPGQILSGFGDGLDMNIEDQ